MVAMLYRLKPISGSEPILRALSFELVLYSPLGYSMFLKDVVLLFSTSACRKFLACFDAVSITFDGIIDTTPSRTLIQISQRSFYFILPPAASSSGPSGESPESGVVPGLDSTNTTADGSHSPSTTPRQIVSSSHSRRTSPSPTRGRKRRVSGKGRGRKGGRALKALKELGKQYTIDDEDDQLAPSHEPMPQEEPQEEKMEVEEGPLDSTPCGFTFSSRSTSLDLDADPDYHPVAVKAEPMVGVVPTAAPVKRPRGRPPKRKRESSGEEYEVRPPAKKSKKGAAAAKASTGEIEAVSSEPTNRKDKEVKDANALSRKKSKVEKPKSLFTTTPARPLSEVVAKEAAAGEAGMKKGRGKGKARVKKEVEAEGEIKIKREGDETEDTKEEKGVEGEEVKVPDGPPPQKPPFTFPLLCYKALQALGGKAPYRAITKWLEKEYPYFALATKEGKDGWEVHRISSGLISLLTSDSRTRLDTHYHRIAPLSR